MADKEELQERTKVARQEYREYLPLAQQLQGDLRDDAEQLRVQEGWDEDTWNGVEEWVDDVGSIWRALRRNRYDQNKTHSFLLSVLSTRLSLSLHGPIPSILPYSDSPLFHILPLPSHTDKLNRPIVVLTAREIVRDEQGMLDDVKEWIWWALEMCRRTSKDWWSKGIVLLVDAAGAGYRNLEVDLLPTLLSVGHNSFPGLLEAVYVINVGWTGRSMWAVVKHLLPKSALERVAFLDTKESLAEVFELDKIPQAYGGDSPYTFSPSNNPIYAYYSRHSSHSFIASISRSTSCTSIADVYYTARNTPFPSRRTSPLISRQNSASSGMMKAMFRAGYGNDLRMTKSRDERSRKVEGDDDGDEEDEMTRVISASDVAAVGPMTGLITQSLTEPEDPQPILSRASSTLTSRSKPPTRAPSSAAVSRIKSLSDFHLYLSPSRLARIDLLSDSSDSEDEPPPPPSIPSLPRRKVLRPALLEKSLAGTPDEREKRTNRPALRLMGLPGHLADDDPVRSYSGRLQMHHAKWLEGWKGTPEELGLEDNHKLGGVKHEEEENAPIPRTISVSPPIDRPPSPSGTLEPSPSPSPIHSPAMTPQPHDIQPYSTSNPFFGYPVVQFGSSIRPRYPRNRKRDLVKTLLFLFMLKLQSWRDSVERALGLNRLRIPSLSQPYCSSSLYTPGPNRRNPAEGLVRSAATPGTYSKQVAKYRRWDKDWWWMIIGMLLLRGTWGRIVLAPLEALGLGLSEWKAIWGAV